MSPLYYDARAPSALTPTLPLPDALPILIALDTETDPKDAVDATFATDNTEAGRLQGAYVKAALGTKAPKLIMLEDRKSTPLNSSHPSISYAVFCLKKKKKKTKTTKNTKK